MNVPESPKALLRPWPLKLCEECKGRGYVPEPAEEPDTPEEDAE